MPARKSIGLLALSPKLVTVLWWALAQWPQWLLIQYLIVLISSMSRSQTLSLTPGDLAFRLSVCLIAIIVCGDILLNVFLKEWRRKRLLGDKLTTMDLWYAILKCSRSIPIVTVSASSYSAFVHGTWERALEPAVGSTLVGLMAHLTLVFTSPRKRVAQTTYLAIDPKRYKAESKAMSKLQKKLAESEVKELFDLFCRRDAFEETRISNISKMLFSGLAFAIGTEIIKQLFARQ